MAKVVSKKAQAKVQAAPAPVAPVAPVKVEAQVQAPVAQVPVVKAKPEKKAPESAEVKWARRLARWSKKAELAGCDSKGLMRAFLGA
jgi:hypothetical protein